MQTYLVEDFEYARVPLVEEEEEEEEVALEPFLAVQVFPQMEELVEVIHMMHDTDYTPLLYFIKI